MVIHIKVIGKIIRPMALENIPGLMVAIIRVIGKMMSLMGLEQNENAMEATIKDNFLMD